MPEAICASIDIAAAAAAAAWRRSVAPPPLAEAAAAPLAVSALRTKARWTLTKRSWTMKTKG